MAYVYLEKSEAIATIYLNRPEKRNALNYDMWVAIADLVKQCEADKEIKVVIFRGVNETAFAAGADIGEFLAMSATEEGIKKYNQAILNAEKAIMTLSKPTIAMIQSYCVGGGCEIAAACDFRFSDEKGKFGITPAKLGHIYNTQGTKNLVDLVGPANAKDILFSARLLDAEEALHIHLINRIYNSAEIANKTYEYALKICENAQFSIRGAKFIISQVMEGIGEDTEEIKRLVIDSYQSDDFKEGVKAFMEKRRPKFKYS